MIYRLGLAGCSLTSKPRDSRPRASSLVKLADALQSAVKGGLSDAVDSVDKKQLGEYIGDKLVSGASTFDIFVEDYANPFP